jgi:xyloglucan-specific exo-beta-1,4-glucanase
MKTLTLGLFSLVLGLFSSFSSGCGGGGSSSSPGPGPGPTQQVTLPTFSPSSGTYTSAQMVSIADTTSGATIYYTTDGSTPTASSAKYSSPITVSSTETLKAIGAANGSTNSSVSTGIYLLSSAAVTPAYTWNSAQIVAGGFITGIVAHPAQQNLMYVRTDIGGAYRWNATTSSWIPLTDWVTPANWNYTGIESIGIDPSDPQRLYLAAGTYAQSWNGDGAILVSTDQGNTFQTIPMPIQMGSNDNGREAGERLAVDPNDGSILYFGSRLNGLWKSLDHGSTWNQVSSFPVTGPTTGAKGDGVGVIFEDFIASSGTSGSPTPVIYVGVSDTGTETTPVYSLYRSTDAGQTWQPVPGQPTGMYPNHGVFGPDGNLYLSYGDDVGPNGMTAGAIWKYTPPPNTSPTGSGTWANITPVFPSQAGYGAVAVDALQPGTIMVTTMDRWGPHDDIYRSIDSGATWTALRAQATDDVTISPWVGILQPTPLGWWMGALAIDPFNSNHVLYGTGATIWVSNNATQAATNWSVGALGIEETAVTQLISPPLGANLVSGMGDICGFVDTTLTQSPPAGMMVNPQFTTTSGLDFAQSAPLIMARVGYNGNASQLGGYTTNGGTTWTPFPSQPTTTQGAGSIAVSADGTTFVWAPSDGPVAYTTNNGTSWAASSGAPAQQLVVADRFNAKKFYMVNGSSLYMSADGGATFKVTNSALPGSGTLSAAPTFEGDLWLATATGLYRSADSGQSFLQISGVQVAKSIGFGKAANGATYPALYLFGQISGTLTFYRSLDGGATWVQISDAQHQYGNASLIIGDPRIFGRVYIGTNGRGIIYGDSPN